MLFGLFVVTDPFSSHLDYLLSEHDVTALQEQPQRECETVQVSHGVVCVCAVCVCVCVLLILAVQSKGASLLSPFTLTLSGA